MIRGMRMNAKTYPAVERISAAIRQPSCIGPPLGTGSFRKN
jgi:hypothetical protein